MTADEINDLTGSLIREFGKKMAEIHEFEAEMVVIEGTIAGLIAFNALRYNKQPDEIVEAFCEGLRERVTRLVYGEKQ